MYDTLGVQKAVSYTLTGLVAIAGLIIAFLIKDKQIKEVHIHHNNAKDTFPTKEEQDKIINALSNEHEQQIMQELFNSKGSIYQSSLTQTLNLSKVKVTRLLDSLEAKGLTERKRKGMTNVVVLKQ